MHPSPVDEQLGKRSSRTSPTTRLHFHTAECCAGPAGPQFTDIQLRRQALPPSPLPTPRASARSEPQRTPRGGRGSGGPGGGGGGSSGGPSPAHADVPADALFLPDGGVVAAAAAEQQLSPAAAAGGGGWDAGGRLLMPRPSAAAHRWAPAPPRPARGRES